MGIWRGRTLMPQCEAMRETTDFAPGKQQLERDAEHGGDIALADLAAGMGRLETEERADWSSAARSARVLELGRAVERLHAELVRAVAAWDGAGDYAVDGSLSGTAWLAHRVPMTRSDAARMVSAARLTRRSERIEKALAAGDITVSHVEMMARAIRRREDIFESHGDVLVDAALAVGPNRSASARARGARRPMTRSARSTILMTQAVTS